LTATQVFQLASWRCAQQCGDGPSGSGHVATGVS